MQKGEKWQKSLFSSANAVRSTCWLAEKYKQQFSLHSGWLHSFLGDYVDLDLIFLLASMEAVESPDIELPVEFFMIFLVLNFWCSIFAFLI